MENERYFETLAAHLEQDASVRNVYGEPVQIGKKTIIPVAKIAIGMGTGYGQGKGNGKMLLAKNGEEEDARNSSGGGAGGGMVAYPVGIFEVTEKRTRYIPANPLRLLVAGGIAGIVLAGLFFRKK